MTVSFETKKPVPRPSVVSTSTTAGMAPLTRSSTDRGETVARAAVSQGQQLTLWRTASPA
jgi:hypothetical protein